MKKLAMLLSLVFSVSAYSADTYLGGKVYDITSTQSGLLIRFEGNVVPSSCPNPNNWGWMVIPEENKTMTSVALAMFTQGKRNATVYTNGTVGSFCRVIQYDPH
ncbi:conserved exported hypothetical protein [Vibrio nigripulchritudo SOn1]|uniref:Uncharacterized protein n=1 Tax=Vibrio nigripulchritudo SOn1 TaxID=1238450 RepID=A0AAV2VYR4_9VIBR|nr:hypothetical protein [Vibrio nigripulchritudo]CCO49523.1 conserved exported hypothetical protein [Vibrio nigripulchritudo SOn1]